MTILQISEGTFVMKSEEGVILQAFKVDDLLGKGVKIDLNSPLFKEPKELTKQDILDLGNAGFSLDDILKMQSMGWLDGRG